VPPPLILKCLFKKIPKKVGHIVSGGGQGGGPRCHFSNGAKVLEPDAGSGNGGAILSGLSL
jgi:hypothetical protein